MDEMEKYRTRLQRKWERRTTKRDNGGRRRVDYKSPPMFTWGTTAQFLTLMIGGALMLLLAGCVAIKKSLFGG